MNEYKKMLCNAIFSSKVSVERSDGTEEVKEAFNTDYNILTDGKISPFKIDASIISSNTKNRDIIIEALTSKVENLIQQKYPDSQIAQLTNAYIVSSESSGIFWGSIVASDLFLPFGLVRKNGQFSGAIPKDSVAFGVDDVYTSLNTARRVTNVTRREGATIENILVIVDRQEYDPGVPEKLGINLNSLLTVKDDILPYGLENQNISAQLYEDIQAYYRDEIEFTIRALQSQGRTLKQHPRWSLFKKHYNENFQISQIINELEYVPGTMD